MDEQHLIYPSTWQTLQPESRQGGKEFEKEPGEARGEKPSKNGSREEMRIFCSKGREIRCQTNHRWKNLKIQLTNAPVQDELHHDKAGKDVRRLFGFFWLHLRVSSAAEQRKVAFSAWPARLCCNCLQGPVSAPNSSSSNVCVALGEAMCIIPSVGWAHVRSDFTLVFPALDPGWDFPFLA